LKAHIGQTELSLSVYKDDLKWADLSIFESHRHPQLNFLETDQFSTMHKRNTNLIRIQNFKFLEHFTVFQDKKDVSFDIKIPPKTRICTCATFFSILCIPQYFLILLFMLGACEPGSSIHYVYF
jgi:hypothetical protein